MAGGADQSVGYIIHFANAVELYQKKNQNCFGCSSHDHLIKDCLKDLSKTTQKVCLNCYARWWVIYTYIFCMDDFIFGIFYCWNQLKFTDKVVTVGQ